MSKRSMFVGETYGKWFVIDPYPVSRKDRKALCKCTSCDDEYYVDRKSMKRGDSTQCKHCSIIEINTKHKLSSHPLYSVWHSMKRRCNDPHHNHYHNYGGKGISVCVEWNEFINFYNDMIEGYEEGLQLDRIDNNGNYCKENCRWVTRQQNSWNTGSRKGSCSKYKGVSLDKKRSRWIASIRVGGKKKYLGSFLNEVHAALAYNEASIKYHGEYANLNVIEEV